MSESYRLPDGTRIVNVHDVGTCVGRHCVIHNPSAHHMRAWPLTWRNDKKIFERQCPHGVGHPDPDQREYMTFMRMMELGMHGCDGCCRDTTLEGEIVVREIER